MSRCVRAAPMAAVALSMRLGCCAKERWVQAMKRPAAQKGESPKRPRHGHECGDTGPSRYAITFGEVALLHVGGKELGTFGQNAFASTSLRSKGNQKLETGGNHMNEVGFP